MKDSNKNIVWLVSYPKSGNTWLRVILENLFNETNEAASINFLDKSRNASSRAIFDSYSAASASNLSAKEIDIVRPEVYKELSEYLDELIFLKVHECWYKNAKDEEIYPFSVSKGVIYLMRNPLDIAVSYAFHNGTTIGKTINNMNDINFRLSSSQNKLHSQLHQRISSWSNHLLSWFDESGHNLHLIRYEDLVDNPFSVIKRLINFLGLDYDNESIERVITYSSFEQLQQQEEQFGFIEKSLKSKVFFRNGKVGNYRDFLQPNQIKSFYSVNKTVLNRFGYTFDY